MRFVIYILTLFLICCKTENKNTTNQAYSIEKFENISCEQLFIEIVSSSNFPTNNIPWNDISILIDDYNQEKISGKIDFNGKGFPSGWVELDLSTLELISISPYTEERTILTFNTNLRNLFQTKCLKNNLTSLDDNEKYSTTQNQSINLPFSINDFISSKNGIEKYVTLKGKEFHQLENILYKKFYDNEYEVILTIFEFNNGTTSFNNYIIISENEVGYDYSIISIKNNVLLSGLVIMSKESDSISNNATIDENLIITFSKPKDIFAKYKIANNGIIEQIFDHREHMKNYQSHL